MDPVVNKSPTDRLASIDAYRGLVMFLMMAEVLRLAAVAREVPDSRVWQFLAWHQTHVEWAGCTLHDLIQPSFSFLVGVALPFSLASRRAQGQSTGWMLAHAAWRATLLGALGIFLRSVGQPQTNYIFVDTLTQIGLGYVPLFLLGLAKPRWHVGALVVILLGYWGWFAAYPLPSADFYSEEKVGVPVDWPHHYTGFAAHWNKNSNPAAAFDRWFLNLFPRSEPFVFNGGGYATLNFIPTLGTMILGLLCGTWLYRAVEQHAGQQATQAWHRGDAVRWQLVAAFVCFTAALAVDYLGLCPIVKRIWTPSWVLFSGGWCFVLMAAFYVVLDIAGWRKWAYPLVVIGSNSIAAYVMAHLFEHFLEAALYTHLGSEFFERCGPYEPFIAGAGVLLLYWLLLWWLYRRKIFLKI